MASRLSGHRDRLTNGELEHLNYFLLRLAALTSQRKVVQLFRGDKVENLFQRLNVPYVPQDPDYVTVLGRLFMIGEKSKHFYREHFPGAKGRVLRIDEDGKEAFEFIFDHLNRAIRSKDSIHVAFFRRNEEFKGYFATRNNKREFVEKAQRCDDGCRNAYKNRYLTLLHQLGSITYKDKSHLISTSSSTSVAEKFSGKGGAEQGMKLYAWAPNTWILPRTRTGELPNYKGRPYPLQKEVSLQAGILPHYIIGVELSKRRFFYNPYLFRTEINNSTFAEGFDVNQEHFEPVLKQTNYSRSFKIVDEHIWEQVTGKR